MNILLLGGTGVIGRALTAGLLERGDAVYVTSRQKHNDSDRLFYLHGNAMETPFLQSVCAMMRWDAIVDFMSYKTPEFSSRLSLLLSSAGQYVFISTARVYADLEHPIKETSPRLLDCTEDKEYLASDEYALTKARQENLLTGCGLHNYTIVRPCITYGDYRLQLGVMEKEEWLYRALKGRTVVFCKEIADRITTMTLGADICRCLLQLVGNPKALGETIHLTSCYHLTWEQIWNIYADAIKSQKGVAPKLKYVSLNDFIECRSSRLKYQVIYDRLYNRDYDVSKERLYVNPDTFVRPEVGLPKCLKTFIEHAKFKAINWKSEAKRDRLTGERASMNEIHGVRNKIKYLYHRYC